MFGKARQGQTSHSWVKTIGLFCLLAHLASCAKPNYIQEAPAKPTAQAPQEKMTCENKFATSGLCLGWSWEKMPTANEMGSLVFKVYRQNIYDQSAVETDLLENLRLVLWMPSMGHGSTPTQVERLDVGTYRAKDVFFIMPGEWELKFQVGQESEVHDQVVVPFTF